MATDAQLPHTPTTQQSPTLLPSKLHHNHEPLRSEMCRYFTLNLRADQARSAMHHGLQQNRYMHVFHGPPYERVEHWNRCLTAAKDDYDEAERRDGIEMLSYV
ncbi:hypothetical protein CC86DRAFT_151300 [Ophiobolus disseminans]|uniref:Uncharacterized protein n=1 Tax=Ophiobolus disseminans TaxID=1469910 RepID=A0A6A6ZCI3_9PLEO|nr:hypothetical protein CC86DRAFT_151300 [Ophiobolus disseminans]